MGCSNSKNKDKALNPVKSTDQQPAPVQQHPVSSGNGTAVPDPTRKQVYEIKEETVNTTSTSADLEINVHPLIHKSSNLQETQFQSFSNDMCCYLFGIDVDDSRKIVKFDPRSETFSLKTPPQGLVILNFSSSVYVSEKCIYITGGANVETNAISNRAFLYNPTENKAEELPQFSIPRYAHTSIVHKDYLYIIGGAGADHPNSTGQDEENILRSCERYSITQKKWEKIGDLNHNRSLSHCFIYQDQIYVVGGYIGKTKRTRVVERYDPVTNKWVIENFKIPKSLESSYIFSPFEDSIQIIGGQGSGGPVGTNYLLDLKDSVYICKRPMHHERVLHKAFQYKHKIFVFGGDDEGTIESYDILKDEWTFQTTQLKNFVEGIKEFSIAQPILVVNSTAKRPKWKISDPADQKCFLFGDENASFILEINFTQKFAVERPIPTSLKLHGHQGTARLQDGTYFLCGGIDKNSKYVSMNAYIYDPQQNTARKLAKMSQHRFTCNVVPHNGAIYVIGGRTWGEDDQAILRSCERYDVQKNQWEKVGDLKGARCSATAFVMNSKLYVFGGYKGNHQRWSNIEVYNDKNNSWETLMYDPQIRLEGSAAYVGTYPNTVFLVGGRSDEGDIDDVYQLSLEKNEIKAVSNLKEKKSMPKLFEYDAGKIFVFGGGEQVVEFLAFVQDKEDHDHYVKELDAIISKMLLKGHNMDRKLLRFGLA